MEISIDAKEIRSTKRALSFLLNYAKIRGINMEELAKKIQNTPAYLYNLPRKKHLVFEEIRVIAEALDLQATINFNNKK
ncbi:MAG: hypothetical protein JXL97_15425 [Bacteroidales bacterium]|nr:hypothetical protein [Bacteroidales bacterium]